MDNSIICQNCGSCDDFQTVQAGPHLSAYCNGCGKFIKHLPQNNPITTLPFGKYKGRELKTLISNEEVRYLNWFVTMPDLKERLKLAVQNHIKSV